MVTLNQATDLTIAVFILAGAVFTVLHRAAARKEINAAKQEVLSLLRQAKSAVNSEEQKIASELRADVERIYGEVKSLAIQDLTDVKVDFTKALNASRVRTENAIQGAEVKIASLIKGSTNVASKTPGQTGVAPGPAVSTSTPQTEAPKSS